MRDQIIEGEMPRYWPPKPSRFWQGALYPVRMYMLRRVCRIRNLEMAGLSTLPEIIGPDDGVLICPNHSHYADGPVMFEAGRRAWRPFHFMEAWHIFRKGLGLNGWVMQRLGGFSIDREGCDRRAIRQAIELLTTGRSLVIFPEGEVYHLNERLMPLREGVAFIALSAQRELEKAGSAGRVWMVPTAIRYRFAEDIRPRLETEMSALEKPMMLKPATGMPMHERIIRFGEMLLTLKEKEVLGRSHEDDGALPQRVRRLTDALLERLEAQHLGKTNAEQTVPVRVKQLRRQLVEAVCDESQDGVAHARARDALADVHLVLQLFSYPGDYVSSNPTPERMAETVEKSSRT
jgi:1-acyl-sn-glycerol-3-phosphate acyltransferase